ncbi:MAG: hypothetical protein JNM09_28870 [Blastocatellia bacterium]|nr:hypothetical protein [Blastocatellia bacterium]
MNVEVGGLKGLQSEVPIILMNKTPNVVKMIGGDKQAILIVPESIRTSDTYTEPIIIQGIIEGVFQIFAFVPVQATVGLTWHAVKEGLSVEAFKDFARLLREKYEQEKKNGTKRPDFVEKMINILKDCEGNTTDENLKLQKFILDKMLADEDVISTAAELINTALSPYTPKKQAKAAGKFMLKVVIDQIKRKKQREKLQKAFKELEEMEKQANEEKDESKKNEINKKLDEKLDEIRRLLIRR